MRLGLELIPLKPHQLRQKTATSNICLSVVPSRKLFSQLTELGFGNRPTIETNPLPSGLQVREKEKKFSRKDDFGKPLRYATVAELKKLNFTSGGSMLQAYLQGEPDDTPIVLFWKDC